MIQVGNLIDGLHYLRGVLEQRFRIALLCDDFGAGLIQRRSGRFKESFGSVVAVHAFVPLNWQCIQSGSGVPVTIGDHRDSRFDLLTAELDDRMHTRAVLDSISVITLQLSFEDRRCFDRRVQHAWHADVNSISSAAVHFRRHIQQLGGLFQ